MKTLLTTRLFIARHRLVPWSAGLATELGLEDSPGQLLLPTPTGQAAPPSGLHSPCSQSAGNNLHFENIPASITPGLTKEGSINCSFDPKASFDFVAVVSIVVSKEEYVTGSAKFSEVAIITGNSAHVDIQKQQLNISSALGRVKGDKEAFLSLTWKYPGSDVIGEYMCTVTGFDRFGHPLVVTGQTQVTKAPVDITTLVERIKSIER